MYIYIYIYIYIYMYVCMCVLVCVRVICQLPLLKIIISTNQVKSD